MKTAIVAVSGGVDSVVLLDMLALEKRHELVVAHFDHGIRDDSAEDARFVKGLAEHYGLAFETRREELGASASEALARERRYLFLSGVADRYGGTIVTAHHGDDVIETMAINLARGTGWRGIAIFDSPIARPLLGVTKKDILNYADTHNLTWHEDSTNSDQRYLRNKIRTKVRESMDDDTKRQLWALWQTQREIRRQIDVQVDSFIRADATYDRYMLTYMDTTVAEELLRAYIVAQSAKSPTRPQVQRALLSVKTARPGTSHVVGGGVRLSFTRTAFIVETL